MILEYNTSYKTSYYSLKYYTPKSSTKGNKLLDVPVGLITSDEVSFGGVYLNINKGFWTISPETALATTGSRILTVDIFAAWTSTSNNAKTSSNGVRPVINLKSTVTFKSGGDGTVNNPYVVDETAPV